MIAGKRYRFKDGSCFPFGYVTATFEKRGGAGWPCFTMGKDKQCMINATDETFEQVEHDGEDIRRSESSHIVMDNAKFYAQLIYETFTVLDSPTPTLQPVTNLPLHAAKMMHEKAMLEKQLNSIKILASGGSL